MSLADTYHVQHSCCGNAAEFASLTEVVDRIEDFLRRTLPAIIGNLNGWKAAKKSRRNEKIMAADLSKELNFAATDELFYFHSEDPQNESATRTLDFGTFPTAHLRVQGCSLGARERLYGIEAKRLPTNETTLDGREREYVVGDWESRNSPTKNLKGGVERLKEGVHGVGLERAGMIAFIQRENSTHWLGKVNAWIADLIAVPLPVYRASWASQDQLLPSPAPGAGVTEFTSTHERPDGTAIHLRHFWLDVTAK